MRGCKTKALSKEAPVSLVPSFVDLLQPLSCVMTAPSFNSFLTLLTGWRLFSAARWSLDELGLAVLGLLIPPLLGEGLVLLGIDDTLARKRGLKVFGVGMHHDPLLSTRKTAITNWGHCWVVLGVICEPLLIFLVPSRPVGPRQMPRGHLSA
jgi:hypothetical protein